MLPCRYKFPDADRPRAVEEAGSMLRSLARRIARAGRLRVEPELAAQAVWVAVHGVTSMLSSRPEFGWHAALSVIVREAVISAIALPEREDRSGDPVAGPKMVSAEALRLLGLLEACEEEGIAFVPFFPLAIGELAKPEGRVAEFASRRGATPAQVALAWLLARSPAILAIPGTSSVAHLEENFAASALGLPAEKVEQLAGAAPISG